MALICKFASVRSRPEKIERWINYLEELEKSHADPQQHESIMRLKSQALSWLAARS
jgi:hypothetical protein